MNPAPENPTDMRDICVRHLTEDGWAHIYLLRYQTPPDLMAEITDNGRPARDYLVAQGFIPQHETLFRFGYFRLSYTPENGISCHLYNITTIPQTINSVGIRTLDQQQFHAAGANNGNFNTLVNALILKAFVELFIQRNYNIEVGFQAVIALDLFLERGQGAQLGFHKDATNAFPTKFFTLTYLSIDQAATAIMKGPTIVTGSDMPTRNAITPAVRHGTNVGVDNRLAVHASPDYQVYVAMPGGQQQITDTPIPAGTPTQGNPIPFHGPFTMRQTRTDGHYAGDWAPHLFGNRHTLVNQITAYNAATARTFFRTWYNIEPIPFAGDLGADAPDEIPLRFDIDIVLELLQPISVTMHTITSQGGPVTEPDDVIGHADIQRMSLGGGKQSSRSKKGKKRTLKRSKRSRTNRRMGCRKKKTRIRTKRTKTKR